MSTHRFQAGHFVLIAFVSLIAVACQSARPVEQGSTTRPIAASDETASSESETAILTELGVPPNVQQQVLAGTAKVVVFDDSAHMDWDWLLPFEVLASGNAPSPWTNRAAWYFQNSTTKGPSVTILSDAATALGEPAVGGALPAPPAGTDGCRRSG